MIFNTKNIYFCHCYQSLYALLFAGSICDRDVVVENGILVICCDNILQMKIMHYM